NAWEVFSYVAANVQRWARDNRDELQTPILLPVGPRGAQRARAMDVTVVRQAPTADSNVTPASQIPAGLEKAWKRYARLANEVPAPAAYTPSQWRLYGDLLLRYEQIVGADDAESAAKLDSRLSELEQAIRRARTLKLSSFQNTLTMPGVAGMVQPEI